MGGNEKTGCKRQLKDVNGIQGNLIIRKRHYLRLRQFIIFVSGFVSTVKSVKRNDNAI